MFAKIRSSQGEKRLAKKLNVLVRQKQTHNFKTAKTAGILFDAGKPDDFLKVREFSKYLSGFDIECSILGYVDADIIPTDVLFRDNVTVFCNKDLDFFFRPSNPDALGFMSKKFDMLFEFSLTDYFPLRYISILSPAAFKAGKYTENNLNLDFMIDIHSQSNLEFLIEQIKTYISILNN